MVTGNSEGVGGGVSKVQISIGKHEAKLEFPEWKGVGEGWGCSNQKNHVWGRYGCFMEQHITEQCLELSHMLTFPCTYYSPRKAMHRKV